MQLKKSWIIVIALAILIKLSLCIYTTTQQPDSKFEIDSEWYLKSGETLVKEGTFARGHNSDGSFYYELFRTPGYPLFLGVFHYFLNWPLSAVIFIQIILNLISAWFIYRAAILIDERLGFLSTLIVLFDPAITVYSLILMTESLFVFFISLFAWMFVRYLKGREIWFLIYAVLSLVAATYVRPVGFYLGGVVAFFIIYEAMISKSYRFIKHAIIFFILFYSLIALWQYHNYARYKDFTFCNIGNATIVAEGIYKSYERNKDPYSKGLPPAAYYMNVASRSFLSVMTRPESFKYFKNRALTVAGKVFAYPWIGFWMIGLIAGLFSMKQNPYFQFLALIILYFVVVTVGGTLWGAGPRFRVPMMPFIAILASFGWMSLFKKRGAL